MRVPEEGHGYIIREAPASDTRTWEFWPEPGTWDYLGLSSLLSYGRIRSSVIELGSRLVDLGQTSVRVGPGYRNAKWDTTFFETDDMGAQSINAWLDNQGISLKFAELLLWRINLLAKRPVPPFCDFTPAGINAEALMVQLENAKTADTISYGHRDQGPAFTVHDEESYRQLVLAPAFKKVVDELLS